MPTFKTSGVSPPPLRPVCHHGLSVHSVADVRLLLCVPYVRCLSPLAKCSRRSRSSSPSCFFPLLYTLQVTARAISFWSPNAFGASPLLPERSPHVVSAFYEPSKTLQYPASVVFHFLIAWSSRAGGQGGKMWPLPLKTPDPHRLMQHTLVAPLFSPLSIGIGVPGQKDIRGRTPCICSEATWLFIITWWQLQRQGKMEGLGPRFKGFERE